MPFNRLAELTLDHPECYVLRWIQADGCLLAIAVLYGRGGPQWLSHQTTSQVIVKTLPDTNNATNLSLALYGATPRPRVLHSPTLCWPAYAVADLQTPGYALGQTQTR